MVTDKKDQIIKSIWDTGETSDFDRNSVYNSFCLQYKDKFPGLKFETVDEFFIEIIPGFKHSSVIKMYGNRDDAFNFIAFSFTKILNNELLKLSKEGNYETSNNYEYWAIYHALELSYLIYIYLERKAFLKIKYTTLSI